MAEICDCLWENGMVYARSLNCLVHDQEAPHRKTRHLTQHIGFGGGYRNVVADFDLGYGVFRAPKRGFRRAIWDFCFGYVSGFRVRDILYFIATRSFKKF